MIWLGIVAAVYVAGLFVLPVTFWRDRLKSQAINTPLFIVMRRGLPVPGAVWAQELYEAKRSWRILPAHLVLMAAGRLRGKWAGYERDFEAGGHEAEVWAEVALTGADPDAVRWRLARDMVVGYMVFRGYTAEQIEPMMRGKTAVAKKFVERNLDAIREKNKGG